MGVEYKISDLIALSTSLVYVPQLGEAVNRALSANSPIEYTAAIEEATSLAYAEQQFSRGYKGEFGLPLFMPLEIESFDDSVDDLLLESAVVDFSEDKNIVITELQGRASTLKEFINNGDSKMTFSGLICGRGYGYPLDQVEQFKKYMRHNQTLRIIHESLNMLDVVDIVVTNWKLSKTPYTNCQMYTFDAISDQPIELLINE